MTVLQPTEPKPKLESWTLWFNTVMSIAGAVCLVLPQIIPPQAGVAGMIIGAVCNFVLRFKTNRPIL